MARAVVSPPSLTHDVSMENCRAYEQLAVSIAQRTIAAKASRSTRERLQPNVFINPVADASPRVGLYKWTPASTILCIGTLSGTLEDAMYGSVTPTQQAMAVRSAIIQDEFIQHHVLQDIRLPTVDEPFQYVGLKWALRASKLATIVKSRDVVYVEASGFSSMQTARGHERVGYVVNHSIELAELAPPTATNGTIRARYSLSTVFRQRTPGVVEIYGTVTSDPGGSLPPKLAALSAAGALIAASDVMECTLNKKLARLLDRHQRETHVAVAKSRGGPDLRCLQCARSLSSYNSLHACRICLSTVCSRCVTTRTLVLPTAAKSVFSAPMDVCKGCVSVARADNATQTAMQEFVLERSKSDSHSHSHSHANDWDIQAARASTRQSTQTVLLSDRTRSAISSEAGGSDDEEPQWTCTPPTHRALSAAHAKRSHSAPVQLLEMQNIEEQQVLDDDDIPVVELTPIKRDGSQQRLMRQMTQLSVQAERTYRMTKHQTRGLLHSPTNAAIPGQNIGARSASRSAPALP